MGLLLPKIPYEKRLNKNAYIIVMENLNRIVEGSKAWIERIQGEDSTAGERMFSSESYFDAFWDAVGHGVAIVSEDGTIVDANPAFCALLDINYEQAIGLNIRRFVADGQWREDIRTIETMALGRQGEIVTEERWNKKLNPNGPFIPVRVRAMRIPTERTRPFRHIILHVYDLRSTRYDMQGDNWGNKQWKEIWKELFVKRFGTIATIITVLGIVCGLNGTLGTTLSSLFENWLGKYKPMYIEKHVPTPNATPTPPSVTDEEKQDKENKSE